MRSLALLFMSIASFVLCACDPHTDDEMEELMALIKDRKEKQSTATTAYSSLADKLEDQKLDEDDKIDEESETSESLDDEISEPNYVDLTDLLDELLNGEGGPSDNAHLTDSYDNEEISEYESESSEELLEEEKDILTEEMGYEETKTETDTQVEEITDEEGNKEEAVLVENATVYTNKDDNSTVVLIQDLLRILKDKDDEDEDDEGEDDEEVVYEVEATSDVELEGQFDENQACSETKPCESGFFCPLDAGVLATCTECRSDNAQCFSNLECCGVQSGAGGVCFFGRCKGGVEKGSRGTQCDGNEDCNEDHCCHYMSDFQLNMCEAEAVEGEACLSGEMQMATGVSEIFVEGCAPCHTNYTCHTDSGMCQKSETEDEADGQPWK
ncbi:dickkopf-related protein 3-like isoform X2 [Symsagittifera roscoffensis]|uniref:dickkopf-related protein 3-like isoform X2 n=1 Tax=Symsagittifera roscoffensis TaxID=84072 RepID=UPI00307C4FC6